MARYIPSDLTGNSGTGSGLTSNKSILTKAQPKKPTVSRHSKNQRSKRTRSNSPDSFKRGNSQPAHKKHRNKTQLSIPEAMVQEAQILDQRERDAAKLNDKRQRESTGINDQREHDLAKDAHGIQPLQFQVEMRQCDQHHELEMLRQQVILNQGQAVIDQGNKRLLQLRASIQRQINQTLIPNHRVL